MKNKCAICKSQSGTIIYFGNEVWKYICNDCFNKLSKQAEKDIIDKLNGGNFTPNRVVELS